MEIQMIQYRRANEIESELDLDKQSILKRTVLVAEKNNSIVGVMEYTIKDFNEAVLLNYNSCLRGHTVELFEGFIEELLYWNPYIKRLICHVVGEDLLLKQRYKVSDGKSIITDQNVNVVKMMINDIVPEQLSVDKNKLNIVDSWIESPEDIVVSCVRIKDKVVCIDGHSRLVAAYLKGYEYVYVHIDENADTELYEECLRWCKEANINSIADLSQRVVSEEEHESIWIDRCQSYLKAMRTSEEMND